MCTSDSFTSWDKALTEQEECKHLFESFETNLCSKCSADRFREVYAITSNAKEFNPKIPEPLVTKCPYCEYVYEWESERLRHLELEHV